MAELGLDLHRAAVAVAAEQVSLEKLAELMQQITVETAETDYKMILQEHLHIMLVVAVEEVVFQKVQLDHLYLLSEEVLEAKVVALAVDLEIVLAEVDKQIRVEVLEAMRLIILICLELVVLVVQVLLF